jgi:hypothetical protein
MVPSYFLRASINISFAFISKWFVGSSKMRRLTGWSRILSSASLLLSPPERTDTVLKTASPSKRKEPR